MSNLNRTALFARNQPGGVFTVADVTQHPASIFFVDSTNAAAADSVSAGRNPDHPLATIDYAIGLCTANAGDVIYVMPNHAETVAAASGIDLDVAGISVVGAGNGDDRPTITLSATASTVEVAAAGVTLRNLVFQVSIDSVVTMIDVNADDFTLENCEFREVASKQWVSAIDLNGGGANGTDRAKVINCRIIQTAAGADQAIDLAQVQDGVEIVGNVIDGDFVNAGIYSASICTNLLIARNHVRNRQTGDHAIEISAAATGFLSDNRLAGDTLGTILDPGSLMCNGNLETDAVDQAGVATPRTSAGGLPDNSITAAAINADAITNAKIADGAISEEQIDADAAQRTRMGLKVTRAAADVLNGGTVPLFTVAGGMVAVHAIVGIVSAFAVDATASNTKFQADPTTGTANDLCATADVASKEIGTMISPTGLAAVAMQAGSGAVPTLANPLCVNIGTIDIVSSADAGTGGALVGFTLYYTPIDTGATVTAI